MNEAVIEECSVSYVIENNKVYTTPENNGEITFKILVKYSYGELIETLTLKAVKNMTWGELIDSEYNTLNFRKFYGNVIFDYQDIASFFLRYDNDNDVELDDFIIPNHEYVSLDMPV